MSKIKRILGGAFVLATMSTMPAFSQAQAMPQQQQQEQVDVSDEELAKFADAYKQMQVMGQQAQQKMATTVEDEGLDIKRFNEIHQATMDPKTENDATEEEMAMHKKIVEKLDGMQKDFQGKLTKIVENQDLSMDRYQQIATALQTDTELQQRLQKKLM
ncbi:MAG TPA: DUF4168 domain-containing protein [Leeuwenhoekiella sp.]|nr:DUF4168 domain-containing protein [Leeuwenhoekiella sp.]